MEIQGPDGVSGPERAEAQKVPAHQSERPGDAAHVRDQVEISEEARLLERLSGIPDVRSDLVEELRRLIGSGRYETAERIRVAVEKLLEEL